MADARLPVNAFDDVPPDGCEEQGSQSAFEPLDGSFDLVPVTTVQAQYCCQHLAMPWRISAGQLLVAISPTSTAKSGVMAALFGRRITLTHMTDAVVRAAITARFSMRAIYAATFDLALAEPQRSASTMATPAQTAFAIAILGLFAIALVLNAGAAIVLAVAFMSIFYVGHFLLRTVAALAGAADFEQPVRTQSNPIADSDLPFYSILVPLYHEADMVPTLVAAMEAIDWPKERREIMLIVEADDHLTIAAIQPFADRINMVRVPDFGPRTKPKALNYALAFSRGEYLVIYDAEDRPEPDQLRKAFARFQADTTGRLACLQARLNCYNRDQNWLTRLFSLDYALWFDFMLPGLERLGLPLPLGGTSNHFRTSVLRHVYAWDPFNVTEDADLGLRLMRHGHQIATLDSTTYEEAAVTLGTWMRQRARWLKGYLITFLVHMRMPGRAMAEFGPFGLIGLFFFIGGSVLTALVNPVFWILSLTWAISGTSTFEWLFDETVRDLSLFSMIVGNLGCLGLWLIAPLRRRWMSLVPWALTAPLYWLLISAAGWFAVYDFFRRPFHWHKTPHGASAAPTRGATS